MFIREARLPWSVAAIPGLVLIPAKSIVTESLLPVAATVYPLTLANLYPTSAELNPVPPVPTTFSMNTSSPTLKGTTPNPAEGVLIKHVNIPVELEEIVLIETPLLFCTANNSIPPLGSPLGRTVGLILDIVALVNFASRRPLLITSLVVGLTILIRGAFI